MIFLFLSIGLCIFMWVICFMGTGNDQKNLMSIDSYPDVLQQKIRNDEDYKDKIKESNPVTTFIANLILFLVIFFICGLFERTNNYLYNFLYLFILGQIINLFDLLVVDLLWFRNVKRARFSKYPDAALYKNMKNHVFSFVRAIIMFTMVAAIDGALLLLF